MNAGGGFGGRVIEAIECLVALCGGQSRPDEELARSNRKRMREFREKDWIELPRSVEQ
jgi:hypothetical protein